MPRREKIRIWRAASVFQWGRKDVGCATYCDGCNQLARKVYRLESNVWSSLNLCEPCAKHITNCVADESMRRTTQRMSEEPKR